MLRANNRRTGNRIILGTFLAFILCLYSVHSFSFRSPRISLSRSKAFLNKLQQNEIVRSKVTAKSSRISKKQLLNPLKFKLSENEGKESTALDLDDDIDDDDDDEFTGEFLQKLSKGVVPLAASVGFAVTPSAKVAARIAGAAAGGVVGLLAKNAMKISIKPKFGDDDGRFSNYGGSGGSVAPSVVKALNHLDGMDPPAIGMTLQELEATAKKFRVPEKELGSFTTHLFSDVIYAATQGESLDLTELSDVLDFAYNVGLTPSEVGDGFALAATRIASELNRCDRGFYVEEAPLPTLCQTSKMFFLADKMIGTTDGYYGQRMVTSLSFFAPESFQEIITDACKNLFRRCIESVLTTPDDFTEDEVDQLKSYLTTSSEEVSTLRPANMQNMIMEAIQFTLDASLAQGTSAMEARVENYDNFIKSQAILGWNEREWVATLETRTTPLFEAAVRDIFTQVQDKPARAEELSELLLDRIQSLRIDSRKARVFITNLISELNREYMTRIDKVYAASGNNVEPAFKIMATYAHTHEAFKILTEGVLDNDFTVPVPGLPFTDMVRVNMYEFQLSKGGDKSGVKSDMFDLTGEQRQLVRKHLSLPKITSWITQCIAEGNFNTEAKTAYRKQLEEFKITDEEWAPTAIDFYYQDVSRIATMRQVPSQADIDRITNLKEFLGCSEEAVNKVNLELLGDKYVKALTEAMTPTGVITEEYIAGLERLRVRLGLSEADAKNLLGVATRARIGPIIKDLSDIWKSDTDANFRREMERKKAAEGQGPKDKSGDPISDPDNVFGYMEMGGQKDGGGPNVFMREALNLIDFFLENYIVQGKELDSVDELQVTASGLVPEEDLVGMFKHYLITRLAEQDPELRQRYIDAEPWFAKVLGVVPEGQVGIKESLAYSAYKSLLMNVLMYKDVIDPQDISQFVMLKESLQLEQESADRIYDEATRGAVIEHAAKLIRRTENGEALTPEIAKRFREQVQSLSLDMKKDTGFNDRLVTYLYALEVQYMVDNGMEDELSEVTDAYDIPEERAEDIIEVSCKRMVSQLLNLALRGAKRYDERDAMRWLKEILKYAVFISSPVDADGNLFSEEDKKRLIAFYQAEVDSGEDAVLLAMIEENGDMTDKLREIINISEDFVAPIQGIEGLLGNVRRLDQLEADMESTIDGKKTWAWG